MGDVAALLALAVAVSVFPAGKSFAGLLLLAVAFAIIACGASLFGLLTNPLARTLGDIGYSIYLVHGVLLFVTFKFVIGFDNAAALSPLGHWLVVLGCAPVLILLCSTTFRCIERPAINAVPRVSAWVESRLVRLLDRGRDGDRNEETSRGS